MRQPSKKSLAVAEEILDHVNYGHINANLWSAYANDGYVVSLPP